MKHAVLGAGGVGGLIGGALAHEGHTVTLIVRPEAVRQTPNRLHVASRVLGDFEAPVAIASGMTEPPDVMWIAVKATQLEAALRVLPADQMAGTLLVPLLNGVDHVARLRAGYPNANIVAGTIRVETERSAPGRIKQLSPFAAIQLATNPSVAERVDRVARDLRAAGFSCDLVSDEATLLWAKLAFLAPLALTTTAKAAPLGEVRSDPAWRARLETCVAEACRAATAAGASVDKSAILSILSQGPDDMRSSMQKDMAAGREPELDGIGGPIVRQGRAHKFDVSTTAALMATIERRLISQWSDD